MFSLFVKFRMFLVHPEEVAAERMSPSQRFRELGALLLMDIFLMMFLSVPILILEHLEVFSQQEHEVMRMVQGLPLPVLLLLGVILVPLLEEVIFRLPLRYRRNYLLRWVVYLSSAVRGKSVADGHQQARKVWQRHYRWVFYGFAVAFAYVHMSNFGDVSSTMWLVSPFLVAPQLAAGLIIGYIRLRQGFIWGVVFHAMHNFVFLAIPIFSAVDTTVVNVEDDAYNIVIEEVHDFSLGNHTLKTGPYRYEARFSSMRKVLSDALKENPLSIEFENKKLADLRLHVSLQVNDSALKTHPVLLGHILQHYELKVDSSYKLTKIYRLDIINRDKLVEQKREGKKAKEIETNFTPTRISLINANMETLKGILETHYRIFVVTEIPDTARYDFLIPLHDKELLNKQLKSYGLELNPVDAELRFLTIVEDGKE